jgi:hypothetical protein
MIQSGFKATAHEACVQRAHARFSWQATVDQIIVVYQDVLEKRAAHSINCQ